MLDSLNAAAADAGKHRMLRGLVGEAIAETLLDVRRSQRALQGVNATAHAEELLLSRINLSLVQGQTLDQNVGFILSGMLDMTVNVISYGHQEKALQVYHYPGRLCRHCMNGLNGMQMCWCKLLAPMRPNLENDDNIA